MVSKLGNCLKMLGVESCLHHHMEGQWRLSGGLCQAGSKHQQVEWMGK